MKRNQRFFEQHMVNLFTFHYPLRRQPIGIAAGTSSKDRRLYNSNALRLLEELTLNPRPLKVEDELTLGLYSGEGGIGGSPHEYYTPFELARAMWDTLIKLGVKGHGLEPSCGTGVLLQDMPDHVTMEAVELSPVGARIAELLFPKVKVHYNSFEAWVISHETVDFVIGNPPFGPRTTSAHLDERHITAAEVYFTLRSLDVLVAGGLAALVLPAGLLRNPSQEKFRLEVLQRAEVLAVHGLPAGTFERSGVSYGSVDVWFLRKREERVTKGLQLLGADAVQIFSLDEGFLKGQYHQQHPQFLHGHETTRPGVAGRDTYHREGEMTDQVLQRLHEGTPQHGQVIGWDEVSGHLNLAQQRQSLKSEPRNRESVGKVRLSGSSTEVFVGRWMTVSPDDLAALQDALRLSEVLKLHGEVLAQGKVEEGNLLRRNLVSLLGEFLNTHGNPHHLGSLKRAVQHHPPLNNLFSAVQEDGELHRHYQTDRQQKVFRFDALDDYAVLRHLRFTASRRTTENIQKLSGHQASLEETERRLFEGGLVLSDTLEWMEGGEFYFGSASSLRSRLQAAFDQAEPGSFHQQVFRHQLEEVDRRSAPRTLEEMNVTVHHPKLPMRIVEGFARSLEHLGVHAGTSVDIHRNIQGHLEVEVNEHASAASRRIGNMVKRYLTQYRRRVDEQDLYDEWDHYFPNWLTEKGLRDEVQALLNEGTTFLAPVFPRDPLHHNIPGFGEDITPHWWQNESTHRALLQKQSITALGVGLGKTLTGGLISICSLMVGHQKSMIVVPKNILVKWKHELLRMKPDLKLLVVGVEERDGKHLDTTDSHRLEKQFTQARDGDFEVILTTVESFTRLGMDWRVMLEVIEGEFHLQRDPQFIRPKHMSASEFELYNTLKVKHLLEQNTITLHDLAAAKSKLDSLEEDLSQYYNRDNLTQQELADKSSKSELKAKMSFFHRAYRNLQHPEEKLRIQYHELGVDVLIVDEAHRFSNIFTFTKTRKNIKYLGASQNPATRGVDLYYKAQVMRKRGGHSLHLLTATPLRNSPVELYSMIKLVAPELWTGVGIRNVDDFVERYCVIESQVQYDPETEEETSSLALTGLKNLTELRQLCSTVMVRYTAADVKLQLPEATPEYVLHKPTPAQESYLEFILDHPLEALHEYMDANVTTASGRLDDDRLDDYRLALLHLLMRVELDLEMLDPETHKGFVSPKVEGLLQDIQRAMDEGSKVVVFVDTKDMPKTHKYPKNPFNYSFHEKLKRLICERTLLEPQQVGIVNADVTPDADSKFEASEKLNSGEFRVLIGNTPSMGEGVDLQQEVKYLLSLDVPINPMRLEQRLGRVIRQGNTLDRVHVRFHVGTRGLDMDYMDILWGKMGWYDSFWNGHSDTIESQGQMIIPNKEKLLALRIKDDQERQAALDLINQREEERETLGKLRSSLKTFRKLQAATLALQGLRRQKFGNTQKDQHHLEEKIRYYRGLLEAEKAFEPLQSHLEHPTEVLIHPAGTVVFEKGSFFLGPPAAYSNKQHIYRVTELIPAWQRVVADMYGIKDGSKGCKFRLTGKTVELQPLTPEKALELYMRDHHQQVPVLSDCELFGISHLLLAQTLQKHLPRLAVWQDGGVRVCPSEEATPAEMITSRWLAEHEREAQQLRGWVLDPALHQQWVQERDTDAEEGNWKFRRCVQGLSAEEGHPWYHLAQQGVKFKNLSTAPFIDISW